MKNFNLNEAVQVGPWRVARKHLLFVIVFGLVMIAFGLIILQTHAFEKDSSSGKEEEEEDEGEEEGDEEGGDGEERKKKKKISSGDWVMIAIMVAAGILSLVAVFACIMVKRNSSRRLNSLNGPQRNTSIYSVQFNSENKVPLPQSYAAPNQLPLWSGQLIQPQQQQYIPTQQNQAPQIQTQLSQVHQAQPQQNSQTVTASLQNQAAPKLVQRQVKPQVSAQAVTLQPREDVGATASVVEEKNTNKEAPQSNPKERKRAEVKAVLSVDKPPPYSP